MRDSMLGTLSRVRKVQLNSKLPCTKELILPLVCETNQIVSDIKGLEGEKTKSRGQIVLSCELMS
jgi:hypothetical protein